MSDSEALSKALQIIESLPSDARTRVIRALNAFFSEALAVGVEPNVQQKSPEIKVGSFSEDRTPTVKEFLLDKKPGTDVEKVACLAYYLAHYREIEDFKTIDVSVLNTEAGQIKFSNAAYAVNNAEKSGFLIPSSRGQKRISALGELYVQALPDRVAAREAISHARSKKRRSDTKKKG